MKHARDPLLPNPEMSINLAHNGQVIDPASTMGTAGILRSVGTLCTAGILCTLGTMGTVGYLCTVGTRGTPRSGYKSVMKAMRCGQTPSDFGKDHEIQQYKHVYSDLTLLDMPNGTLMVLRQKCLVSGHT